VAGTIIGANSVDTIAGDGLIPPYDGGLAGSALIGVPVGVALDPNGNLFLTDVITGHLRFVNRGTTTLTLFPGTEAQQAVLPGTIVRINKDAGTGEGGTDVPANRASFNNPQGVFATSQGVYIVDSTGGPTVPQAQLQNAKRTGVIRFHQYDAKQRHFLSRLFITHQRATGQYRAHRGQRYRGLW
jgi:hypothetical protein